MLGRAKRHGIIGIELGFPPFVGDVLQQYAPLGWSDGRDPGGNAYFLGSGMDSFWDSVLGMLNL